MNAVKLLFLLAAAAASTIIQAQSFTESLDAAMETHGAMGISALVVCNGQVAESYYGGMRNYENDWPVTSDTRYRIASISKSITAMGCMKLVETGAMDLDADISSYLPFAVQNPNHPDATITTRMLLSHTSSVQDGDGYSPFLTASYQSTGDLPSLEGLLEPGGAWYTSNMYRTEAPGTFFAYSNLNFGLVATIMEAVTGTRFDALMDSLIFEPMGLGCSYDVGALDGIENLAALYRNQGGWVAQADQFNGVNPGSPELADYTPGTNGTRFAPQGGLRASAHELYELMCVQLFDGVALNGAVILDPSTVAAMRTTEWTYDGDNGNNYYNLFNSWGLGIQRITNTAMGDIVIPETTMWGHPGEAYGLISDWYFDPETKNGVIFLTNGAWNGYSFGNNSAFYTLEEDVFEAAEAAFSCTSGMHDPSMQPETIAPNFGHPGDPIQANFNRPILWVNMLGQTVAISTVQGKLQVPDVPAGAYFLQTAGEAAGRFTVL